jgi:hypothetical protein
MGCYNCSKKKNILHTLTSASVKKPGSVPCTQEETNVIKLEAKLRCVMKLTSNSQLNAALGKLLSMINLKDYCRYDLEAINDILNDYPKC